MNVRRYCLPLLLLVALSLAGGCGQRSWQSGGVPGSKPYTVRGKTYYPLKSAHGFVEVGTASWYGPGFHGKTTSSGERFNQYAMTAAHKILPLGTKVRVTNIGNGKSVIVRINDRGPFVDDRVIDLSRAAGTRIGIVANGTGRVRIQSIGDVPEAEESSPVAAALAQAAAQRGGASASSSGWGGWGGEGGSVTELAGSFFVQIGAFGNKDNAERLVAKVRSSGMGARSIFGSNNLWNVQVGPWPDTAAARNQLNRLRSLYPHAFIIGN